MIRPEDTAIRLLDAPDDSGERSTWKREAIGGELDYNTLGGWTTQEMTVQMIVDDWFIAKNLPDNPIATEVYLHGAEEWSRDTHPGIKGVVVIECADRFGDEMPLPSGLVDRWILAGIRVTGQEA